MSHFLITGHTGFKGSWLVHLLKHRGHDVSGISLEAEPLSLFHRTNISTLMKHDLRVDIRNEQEVKSAFERIKPNVVIHMAAIAQVRDCYLNPVLAYETNVLGTYNILMASESISTVEKILVITSDKVYRPSDSRKHMKETDELGGVDPYSSSKAIADNLAQTWLSRPGSIPGAIARAGNVIGAGDVSNDRLIPGILKSALYKTPLLIRYPDSVRPWQHILDCLRGYMSLAESISHEYRGAWNFGPNSTKEMSVREVVEFCQTSNFPDLEMIIEAETSMLEQDHLMIDSRKAQANLGWSCLLSVEDAILWSISSPNSDTAASWSGLLNRQISDHEKLAEGQNPSIDSLRLTDA